MSATEVNRFISPYEDPAPEGAELNSPDQISPAEPAGGHVLDPAGSVH